MRTMALWHDLGWFIADPVSSVTVEDNLLRVVCSSPSLTANMRKTLLEHGWSEKDNVWTCETL
jgi:hypothetical protein